MRFGSLQTALYWVQFSIVLFVLTFPLTVYESHFREHKYGHLATNLVLDADEAYDVAV